MCVFERCILLASVRDTCFFGDGSDRCLFDKNIACVCLCVCVHAPLCFCLCVLALTLVFVHSCVFSSVSMRKRVQTYMCLFVCLCMHALEFTIPNVLITGTCTEDGHEYRYSLRGNLP